MTAIEYLREMQSKANISFPPMEEMLEYRREQIGNIDKNLKEKLEHIKTIEGQEEFFKETVINPFLNSLSKNKQEKLENIPVGLLPTFNPNACAMLTPDNHLLVLLHTGLMGALSYYNEVQLLSGKLMMNSEEYGIKFLYDNLKNVLDCFTLKKKTFPLLPTKLTFQELHTVQFKTFAQEMFVIAHEFAHIYLGHLDEFKDTKLILNNNEIDIEIFNRNQEMELEADVQAVQWLVNYQKTSKYLGTRKMPVGFVSLAIEVFMLFHLIEVNQGFPTKDSDHPPSYIRLANIMKECKLILDMKDMDSIKNMLYNASDVDSFKL